MQRRSALHGEGRVLTRWQQTDDFAALQGKEPFVASACSWTKACGYETRIPCQPQV